MIMSDVLSSLNATLTALFFIEVSLKFMSYGTRVKICAISYKVCIKIEQKCVSTFDNVFCTNAQTDDVLVHIFSFVTIALTII